MAQLNNCPHCGSVTEFAFTNEGRSIEKSVFARCTNCKIQTLPVASSLEYSAMDKVADIWNARNPDAWPDWEKRKGSRDAYSRGSKVSHGGERWISNVDTNVGEPGVSGWTKQ